MVKGSRYRSESLLALIVDDHALIRDALRGVLARFDEIAEIIEANAATQAERLLAENPIIDLVLLDIALPDRDGMDLLHTIRADYPSVSVVMLSGTEDRNAMTAALEAGASGFIPKSATRDIMHNALRLVLSGGIYVPPEILSRPHVPPREDSPPISARAGLELGLTERQIEVLRFMMRGKSNKEICRELGIAEPTVKNHVTAILRALNASNRTEAVIAATSLGVFGRETS